MQFLIESRSNLNGMLYTMHLNKLLHLKLVFILFIYVQKVCNTLWKGVNVATEMLDDSAAGSQIKKQILELQMVNCGTLCDSLEFCSTWCYSNNKCILTDILLSPGHLAVSTTNLVKCFTTLKMDFALGSTVISSPVNPVYPERVAENLAKGIYNKNSRQTCAGLLANSEGPWIVFDIEKVVKIKEIRVTTQDYTYAGDLPHGAEIKIGKFLPTIAGQFDKFKLIGTLPNPSAPLTTYILQTDGRTSGRFVSIQKPSTTENFAICFFMIL